MACGCEALAAPRVMIPLKIRARALLSTAAMPPDSEVKQSVRIP